MTEAEWQTCTDVARMLGFAAARGATDRKLLLFACACLRRVWPLLTDPESRAAVGAAERFADGELDRPALHDALVSAGDARLARLYSAAAMRYPQEAVSRPERFRANARDDASYGVRLLAGAGRWCLAGVARAAVRAQKRWAQSSGRAAVPARRCERTAQVALVRDVFGNPFRVPPFDPLWRTETVVLLARHMYETRDFSAMPVLADALQEQGCENEDVLGHCRRGGPHCRGCWVVDLVLGKA